MYITHVLQSNSQTSWEVYEIMEGIWKQTYPILHLIILISNSTDILYLIILSNSSSYSPKASLACVVPRSVAALPAARRCYTPGRRQRSRRRKRRKRRTWVFCGWGHGGNMAKTTKTMGKTSSFWCFCWSWLKTFDDFQWHFIKEIIQKDHRSKMSRFLQDSCLNDTWLAENCSVVIFIFLWEIPMGDSSTDSRCSSWMASHHCDAFSHAVVLAFTVILNRAFSRSPSLQVDLYFWKVYWIYPNFPIFLENVASNNSHPHPLITNRFINSRRASRSAQEIPTQRSGGALGQFGLTGSLKAHALLWIPDHQK